MALFLAACPAVASAAPAAQVDFAVGNVTAVGSNGQSRPLGKGAKVEQGDTVNTNGGRAQLRFTDGAYVSLQPQSQFRIDQYKFEGKQDGSEKGFFSLLKGGLRTITGLVGRSNKANYQVSTAVATIGIRGTEYTIQYGQSITGTVGEGEIEVCNGTGCLSVTNGESYYVQGQEFKPVLTNKRTDLPPPEPTQPPSNFTQGNNTNAAGQALPGFAITGTPTLDFVYVTTGDGTYGGAGSGQFTIDGKGGILSYPYGSGTIITYGNDGIIAWGTALSAYYGSYSYIDHFVAGTLTQPTDFPLAGTTASYVLIGSTPITNSSGVVLGSLNSSSLTIDFGTGGVAGAMAFGTRMLAGDTSVLNGSASFTSNIGVTGQQSPNFYLSSGSCTVALASCSFTDMYGALFGPQAVRAGVAYGMTLSVAGASTDLVGAAAYAKK